MRTRMSCAHGERPALAGRFSLGGGLRGGRASHREARRPPTGRGASSALSSGCRVNPMAVSSRRTSIRPTKRQAAAPMAASASRIQAWELPPRALLPKSTAASTRYPHATTHAVTPAALTRAAFLGLRVVVGTARREPARLPGVTARILSGAWGRRLLFGAVGAVASKGPEAGPDTREVVQVTPARGLTCTFSCVLRARPVVFWRSVARSRDRLAKYWGGRVRLPQHLVVTPMWFSTSSAQMPADDSQGDCVSSTDLAHFSTGARLEGRVARCCGAEAARWRQ